MGLHEAFNGNIQMMWTWYYAVPHYQQSKMHVIEVPRLPLERDRILVPTWTTNRENYLRTHSGLVIPNEVRMGQPKRACQNRQQAESWVSVTQYSLPRRWTGNTRKVCRDCWEMHGEEVARTEDIYRTIQYGFSWRVSDGLQIWRDQCERYHYNGDYPPY
jgi:hypothetical protein